MIQTPTASAPIYGKQKINPATGLPYGDTGAGAAPNSFTFGGGQTYAGPDPNMGPMPAAGAPAGYGYTAGPAGTAGGLTPGTATSTTTYGYGTSPGSSNRGYYEQQTPAGSFAAADTPAAPAQSLAQPYGTTAHGYTNQYLGATTPGVGGAPTVMQYAQPGFNSQWLGQSAGQVAAPGSNPFSGSNPELERQISTAQDEARRQFELTTMPAIAAQKRASGSFGNSAISELEGTAYSDLAKTLGNISSGMRFQDYTTQQQLAENALNRTLQADTTNAGLRSGDLSRNLAASLQQQGLNIGQLLDAAKFDSGNSLQTALANAGFTAADLGRNANIANSVGQFNAGAANTADTFNAGARNAASIFNAGQGNQLAQFFTNLVNGNNTFNANSANNMLTQARNLNEQGRQFDEGLNWNIDQGNWNRERTGTQDQIALLGQLLGWNQGGVNDATTINNTQLNILQQLAQIANGIGGQGGTATQNLQGNPLLGIIGGLLAGNSLFGGTGGKP